MRTPGWSLVTLLIVAPALLAQQPAAAPAPAAPPPSPANAQLVRPPRPREKVIRIHTLPQRAPGQPAVDDNFMGLLFGMSAQEAQRRYELTVMKQDQWYYYLSVKPRLAADRAEFTEARLALWVPGSAQ